MIIIFTLAFFVGVLLSLPKPKSDKTDGNIVVKARAERRCPPHKWNWRKTVDENGNDMGEQIYCEHCGPLKGGDQ